MWFAHFFYAPYKGFIFLYFSHVSNPFWYFFYFYYRLFSLIFRFSHNTIINLMIFRGFLIFFRHTCRERCLLMLYGKNLTGVAVQELTLCHVACLMKCARYSPQSVEKVNFVDKWVWNLSWTYFLRNWILMLKNINNLGKLMKINFCIVSYAEKM